ncbi:MAG: hypothetical protein IJE74_06465 [Clostridia bacterium]|nr:hypothetical protein [Clostridia bacterium]
MKIFKSASAIFICLIFAVLPGCKNIKNFSIKSSELKIGVENLSGNYNPFYADEEADIEVISQMFRSIQIKGNDNSLINSCGSISYEFIGDNRVKYTVSIDDNLYFSDGTHITIDDIIFYYHFISDATYDGTYKDWYLNDIVGLKEYYFDDSDYKNSISEIERNVTENYSLTTITADDYSEYLFVTKLEGKYNGIDEKSPSGITWKEYISKLGYNDEIDEISENPSDDKWLKLVAKAEAESNPMAYNPESWYREQLYSDYLKMNYSDGTDVNEISGIKKINDYTCSILFNSRNINAVSQINALIIPMGAYSAEYMKGKAQTVKEMTSFSVGSGPYVITDSSDEKVKMSVNGYYEGTECEFDKLEFIDLADKENDPVESVISGKVDVIKTVADTEKINALKDKPVQYFINNCNYYISVFYNTRSLDFDARKALMSICNPTDKAEQLIGSYYTRIMRPMSIRFSEYPSDITEVFYSDSVYTFYSKLNKSPIKSVTSYYSGADTDFEYSILEAYKEILKENGVELQIVLSDEATCNAAILSGQSDLWIERVYDEATCDKYNYYNSLGISNKTGINNPSIDDMTSRIRSAVGFSDKSGMTSQLMTLIMEQAIEWPLYQLQTITVYNTETVNPDSIINNYTDGFTYYIPNLKPVD